LDCSHHGPNSRRIASQHRWLLSILRHMVLACRIQFEARWVHVSYLMLGVMLPMYLTTFSLWVAAMSLNPAIAAQLFGFFFRFIITLQVTPLPFHGWTWSHFWRQQGRTATIQAPRLAEAEWTYRRSPYTYVIEGSIPSFGLLVSIQD
jgi:hypothetical protein